MLTNLLRTNQANPAGVVEAIAAIDKVEAPKPVEVKVEDLGDRLRRLTAEIMVNTKVDRLTAQAVALEQYQQEISRKNQQWMANRGIQWKS